MRRAVGVAVVSVALCALSRPATAGQVDWRACTGPQLKGLQCATVTVPKDYADPGKGTFDLAVVRAKATGKPAKRIGTLFFNPGGPGVPAVDLVPAVLGALPAQVRQRFDFVTWDPRGVGQSQGLSDCTGGEYTLPATGAVDWNAVTARMRSTEKSANETCAAAHPDVVPYIGTNNTARDLDTLRQAVGDRQLTYWGTSYGTRIGAVYAHMFPTRVRAMLLSSPVDPHADWSSFAMGAGVSPDNAVGLFFQARPKAHARYDAVTAALAGAPLPLPSGASITTWDVQALVANAVASASGFQDAAQLLRLVDDALTGSGRRRQRAMAALDTQSWPHTYQVNGGATAFVGCLDLPQRLSAAEQDAAAARLRATAPVFGFGTSQALFYCEGVSVSDPIATDYVNTTTPMLIVASTRDALTEYQWGTSMSRTFGNSRLISFLGTVHTPVYTAGSRCLDRAATDYLVSRVRPKVDISCPATQR